ncbi:Neuronal calcium sensor 2 [Halotydeus destructor]|nr:Neuronal calcium sensor 2 [Halotydeus destructor]
MGCSLTKTTAMSLTDEDIGFLTKNTRYSATEIRDWYTAFLKDCPDGKLTKAKFIEIYKMFFSTGNPQKYCEQVYRTFDANNDGSINFKEFLLAIGVTTGSDPREKLKWAFKMYDINNDGLIERDEMANIIKALYEMLDDPETGSDEPMDQAKKVQFLFDKMDANKDGRVSLEEFIDVCNQDENLAKLLTVGAGGN